MKAVVFMGDRKLKFVEFPDPTPGPGEAIIEIMASGMCCSDLKMCRAIGGAAALGLVGDGTPLIAGHEPCGIVAAVGEGVPEVQAKVGDQVMDHHYSGCGFANIAATAGRNCVSTALSSAAQPGTARTRNT
tara:strand:- start:11 stop:403 length:393 start_codon:yes stop_codon:yes gene_type:complete